MMLVMRMNSSKPWNSQAGQDRFVLECLNYKRAGTYLEIGSNDPIHINNTYPLETTYGWRGIMVEYEACFLPLYKAKRPNSIYLIGDATKMDYAEEFRKAEMPHVVDYLQIDLEANNRSTLTTLELLEKQVMGDYTFATVTFEHDVYRGDFFNTRAISREIFERHGYVRVASDVAHERNPYEDWYVHPSCVDMSRVACLEGLSFGLEYTDVLARFSKSS
jgi:hypothetical protein